MKRGWMIAVGVLVVLAVAGGSFYGGMVVGKNQGQTQAGQFGPGQEGTRRFIQGTPGAGQFGTTRGGMLAGTIETVGEGVMTVKDENGKLTQVTVTDTTLIQKQASVTLSDLQPGETVMVSGSQGADGSITARSVQVGTGEGFILGGQPGQLPPGGTPAPAAPGGSNP